jgi:methylglutaconyl-CoA hydratase
MNELRIEQRGCARWLILNRPEKRNALSRDLVRALHGAVTNAADYDEVRCIVLAGAGPVFCAGADLNEFREEADPALLAADGEMLSRLLDTMARSPKPVITRVHGAALGGGVGLVAASDFAIADSGAKLGLSEVRLGLLPAVIGPFVLRALGYRNANALMLSGSRIDAEEACRIGLVQQVVEPNALDATIDALSSEIALGAPGALAHVKQLLDLIDGRTLEDARDLTVQALADRRMSAEGQEGMAAFLEKRRPNWAPNA